MKGLTLWFTEVSDCAVDSPVVSLSTNIAGINVAINARLVGNY